MKIYKKTHIEFGFTKEDLNKANCKQVGPVDVETFFNETTEEMFLTPFMAGQAGLIDEEVGNKTNEYYQKEELPNL